MNDKDVDKIIAIVKKTPNGISVTALASLAQIQYKHCKEIVVALAESDYLKLEENVIAGDEVHLWKKWRAEDDD